MLSNIGLIKGTLLVLISTAVIVSVGAQTPASTNGVGMPVEMVKVTMQVPQNDSNAIPITAGVGTNIIVKLKSNRTTGYEWQLANTLDVNLIKLVESKYIVPEDTGGLVETDPRRPHETA